MDKEKRKQSQEEQLNKLFSIGADTSKEVITVFAKKSSEECGIYHNNNQIGVAQLAPGQNRFDENDPPEEDDNTEEDENDQPLF